VATDDALSLPKFGTRNRYLVLTVCGWLLLAVGLVFVQTACHEFVNYDDGLYVYDNPPVSHGLTARGIVWAFTHFHAGYWSPLTWLSMMLDCQLYGLSAGGHHLSNMVLHAATVILLFLVLWQMTGGFWPSALAAAVFAIHPLRVESVAWVTERKDVLSGLFFVLALGAYVRYVQHPFSVARYLAIMVCLALGLMAKPIVVTLPLVLLLLDYWPLGRLASDSCRNRTLPHCNGGESVADTNSLAALLPRFPVLWQLVIEKLPLLLLAAIFCGVTVWTQAEGLVLNKEVSSWWRIANALVSYVAYLEQFVCPVGLAVFYPHPGDHLPIGNVLVALIVLALISTGVLACRRRCPYLLMGWLWYLGMLAPVIGLVQAGWQARADRFTYLPQIGLCIALAWGAAGVLRSYSCRGGLGGTAAALVLAVLMGCAWRQTSFWSDTETLWAHAVACTSRNFVAYQGLGRVLAERGKLDEAMAYYRKSLESKPDYAAAYEGLGLALVARGQHDEAMACYQKALTIEPDSPELYDDLGRALAACGRLNEAVAPYRKALELQPHDAMIRYDLANALAGLGQFDEAIEHYQTAVKSLPDHVQAYNNLGIALASCGRLDEAIAQFERALKLKPDDAGLHSNLANALTAHGRPTEALVHYETALKLQPNHVETQKNLAWLRATCSQASLRNGTKAVELAERANKLCGGRRPDVLDCLGAAYAAAGWFPEALVTARQALELATQQNAHALADALRARIALYEAGKPFYQTPSPSGPRPTR
jgi:tetratricopeptide (TPR) repeat protein